MAKTISFTAMHMVIAFAVGWAMTGSWMVGGALALVEPLCNSVGYYFHEKAWVYIDKKRNKEKELDVSHAV